MIGALWILAATVVVGVILYLLELRHHRRHPAQETAEEESASAEEGKPAESAATEETEASEKSDSPCCGMHLVCEKDSLTPMTAEIVYYDDEELDRFAQRDPNSYTPEETDEFQEILDTMRPEDAAGWARSLTQRRIELPPDVRDQLLMIVNEQRALNR